VGVGGVGVRLVIDNRYFTTLNVTMKLTDKDLDAIRQLVKITIDEELEEKLNEKLRYFPSKEDFFSKMDDVMGELRAIRENQDLLTNRVYDDHEPRITKIEKKLQIEPVV
jgi:hypothetical protein